MVILARYREWLSGRVLEIGCGAGRILGYLLALDGEVHGIDVAPNMVDFCHSHYPKAHVRVGDARSLGQLVDGSFAAVFPSYNLLDVFDEPDRRGVLNVIRGLLQPGGLLIFSSHNLADHDRARASRQAASIAERARRALTAVNKPPGYVVRLAVRKPREWRNRRRLGPLQRRELDYALVNDVAFDFGLLHYYIRRDDQVRKLSELGYEVIEVLDLQGRTVPAGQDGTGPELHYIARAP
ncbi:MAG: class I SAM-dependent methyltransferase [Solirubrobacteraceae bacterium]